MCRASPNGGRLPKGRGLGQGRRNGRWQAARLRKARSPDEGQCQPTRAGGNNVGLQSLENDAWGGSAGMNGLSA